MKFKTLWKPSVDELGEIEQFVSSHPHTCYFQSSLFFASCKSSPLLTPLFFLAYTDTGSLVGTLLAFRQDQYSIFPLSFLSSRCIIWGGPLVKDHDPAVLKGLYEHYEKTRPAILYTQVRNLSDPCSYKETMQHLGYGFEDHLEIVVDLEKSEDLLWKEVHTKRRNEIRRALDSGICFQMQNDLRTLEGCYDILKEVYQRARLPLPAIDHFRALLGTGDGRDGLKLFVVKFEEKIIGCMLCLAYNHILFDYYAGAYKAYYSKYPNDLLPWEVFKWGKANGYTRFDFGGAGKPDVPYGVRDYKKKFGGTLVNYGRYEKIHHPFLYKAAVRLFGIWKLFKR